MQLLEIAPEEAGQRLDKLLGKYLNQAGKGFLYKMMRKKNITLNGKKCDGSERLKAGDQVRLFLAEHFALIEKLLLLKQADYSACKDDLSPAPTVEKWKKIMAKMEAEGAPLTLSQLKIGGKELAALGYRGKEIGEELSRLFRLAVPDGKLNDPAKLKELAARNLPSGGK